MNILSDYVMLIIAIYGVFNAIVTKWWFLPVTIQLYYYYEM